MERMNLKCFPELRVGDFETMCYVTCPQNLIETELFLLTLKHVTNDFFESNLEYSENLLNVANKLVKSSDIETSQEGVRLLNKIIYRTSINTTAFLDAVLARSVYFVRIQKYPLARNDLLYYKTFDPKIMTTEGIVLVQTLLCLSLYLMREMHDARLHLQQLEEVMDRLPENLVATNFDQSHIYCFHLELHTFLQHLEKYKSEIKDPSSNIQYEVRTKSNSQSFNRLCTRSPKCKGEVIQLKDRQIFQFSRPFMNCEVCGVYGEHLYTCSKCRYKTYCSLACIETDWEGHQSECYGYEIGILQMLKATLLFKVFLQAAKFLSPAILDFTQEHGPIRNATAAWQFIVKYSNSAHANTFIGKFLSSQPECKQLRPAKWRQLITTAFRLAVFVYNDTNINERFFPRLELPKLESIKLIAAILMRLNLNMRLNSERTELHYKKNIPARLDCLEHKAILAHRMNINAFRYYSIDAHSEFVNCFNKLQDDISSTKDSSSHDGISFGTNIYSANMRHGTSMSEYINKLFILCLNGVNIQSVGDFEYVEIPTSVYVEQCLDGLNTSERCKLLSTMTEYFHKFLYDYFCYDGSRRQEKLALCGSSKSFCNSCIANMNISGSLKYTATIMSGETDTKLTNVHQGIFCAFCEQQTEITAEHGECSLCHITYSNLLRQYTTFIAQIVSEIRAKESNQEVNQRDLAILYGTYNSYITMHFSEGSELRLSGVLSFVEFLTLNGFLNHACEIIFGLRSSDYSYTKHDKFGNDINMRIYNIVRRIVERYIESLFSTCCLDVNPNYPKMLLGIMLHILNTQQQYLDVSTDDIETYNTFLENYTQYYKWRKIINSNLTMSISLQNFLNII